MAMSNSVMGVRGTQFHIDEIQSAVTNTALRNDFLGKFAHAADGSFEHHRLETLVMV